MGTVLCNEGCLVGFQTSPHYPHILVWDKQKYLQIWPKILRDLAGTKGITFASRYSLLISGHVKPLIIVYNRPSFVKTTRRKLWLPSGSMSEFNHCWSLPWWELPLLLPTRVGAFLCDGAWGLISRGWVRRHRGGLVSLNSPSCCWILRRVVFVWSVLFPQEWLCGLWAYTLSLTAGGGWEVTLFIHGKSSSAQGFFWNCTFDLQDRMQVREVGWGISSQSREMLLHFLVSIFACLSIHCIFEKYLQHVYCANWLI